MTRILKLFAIALLLCSCGKSEEAKTSQQATEASDADVVYTAEATKTNEDEVKTSKLTIKTDSGDVVYTVETARTDEELERGLMDRDSLPAKHGMIFDLSKHQSQLIAMWMKNTKIPLDMLFIDPEGVIYWVKENAQPMSEQLIIPPATARAVIEINGHDVEKYNIKVGQKVDHALFDEQMPQTEVSAEKENSAQKQETPEEAATKPSADAK